MSILSKVIYRFNVILIKIPIAFVYRATTNNSKICIEPQKTPNNKAILWKNKAGGFTIPDFKIYYKAVVIKTVWPWHKNRHIDQ